MEKLENIYEIETVNLRKNALQDLNLRLDVVVRMREPKDQFTLCVVSSGIFSVTFRPTGGWPFVSLPDCIVQGFIGEGRAGLSRHFQIWHLLQNWPTSIH